MDSRYDDETIVSAALLNIRDQRGLTLSDASFSRYETPMALPPRLPISFCEIGEESRTLYAESKRMTETEDVGV